MEASPNSQRMSNEQLAAKAFSRQSSVFDIIYGNDTIVQYKRSRVREHVLTFLQPHSDILELNCGTGEDALYFAGLGHSVHATDYAPGMLEQFKKKLAAPTETPGAISTERCSFTELSALKSKGPYDLIFSNFAGLNCTGNLDKVLQEFDTLLKPGGLVTLTMLPPFCLWETLLVFKGKWKTAFRRWFSKHGRQAKVEGLPFRCWYYHPASIQQLLGASFETIDLEGLCTIVPPSYMEGFAQNHPRLYATLCRWENKYRRSWPWRNTGDYFIITLRKKH
jgi:ubiquinone/menaquinone biosynthesis C-methylase UbiE